MRGPYAGEPAWPEEPRLAYEIHHAPPRLDELMQRASYALTVYGVTRSSNCSSTGAAPWFWRPRERGQAPAWQKVGERGVALTAQSPRTGRCDRLASLMDSHRGGPGRLSRKSRELTSGDGAEALAGEILTMMEER
ncbi:MAG: hypothetical protein U5K31_02485 [Balneolaceae bacterium]|nr:hypothetical protein [Balneolaceae bacterium]